MPPHPFKVYPVTVASSPGLTVFTKVEYGSPGTTYSASLNAFRMLYCTDTLIRFEEEQKIEQRYYGNSTDVDELAQILRALLYLCIMCTPANAAILELSRLALLLIYLSQAYVWLWVIIN